MTRKIALVASLSLCLLTHAAGTARATTTVKNEWKAYYPNACANLTAAANACTLCHISAAPRTRNPYGLLLETNGHNYAAANGVDSDGDGRTNGQEITNDCTFPGDAMSPTDGTAWGALKATYR